jgi:phage gpG-like protein
MAKLVIKLTRKIKQEKLSGQVLKNRTGRLRGSINPKISQSETVIEGIVGTNKEYAPIHEYGGSFIGARKHLMHPPHLITRAHGERVMTGSPFGMKFPERSFMRTALSEMEPEIRAEFEKAVFGVIRRT